MMANVTISPFMTVPVGETTVTFPPPPPVTGLPWAPAQELIIGGDVALDTRACREMAGLPRTARLLVGLEAWCDETYWSALATKAVEEGAPTVRIELRVPPGSVYGRVGTRRLLILGEELAAMAPGVASRQGSILAASPSVFVSLTGDGGQFPTALMNFAAAGLPSDARWSLAFEHESLEDPVLGTVTLWLNEKSPAVCRLRSAEERESELSKNLGRDLRRFVVEQILREAVADEQLGETDHWPEHSVGQLLVRVTQQFAGGRSLDQLRTMARHERQQFEAVMQAAVPDPIR